MLALYSEDKTKFRKQQCSTTHILWRREGGGKKKITCKIFHETRSTDSENRLDVFSLSLHENYDNDFVIYITHYISDSMISRALF